VEYPVLKATNKRAGAERIATQVVLIASNVQNTEAVLEYLMQV